jgi:lipoprotein signal peptidase
MKTLRKLFTAFLLLIVTAAVFTACAPASTGVETISFGQAFGVVSKTASYWVWLAIAAVISGALIYIGEKRYEDEQEVDFSVLASIIAGIVIFVFALLYRPSEIAANTSVEQFNRGVIIGY